MPEFNVIGSLFLFFVVVIVEGERPPASASLGPQFHHCVNE